MINIQQAKKALYKYQLTQDEVNHFFFQTSDEELLLGNLMELIRHMANGIQLKSLFYRFQKQQILDNITNVFTKYSLA